MRQATHRTLVWALDPFAGSDEGYRAAASFLGDWRKVLAFRILPVFVLSGRQFGLGYELEYDSPRFIVEEAERRMSEAIARLRLKDVAPPEVLECHTMSRIREADALSAFAVGRGADWILLNTHARAGLKRLLLGSFTEAALLRSQVPVLAINPAATAFQLDGPIVFPTELGPYASRVFRQVVDLAADLGTGITLVHVTFGRETRRVERRFRSWVKRGEARGVPIDFIIVPPGPPVTEAVLSIANRLSAGLVALESESGWVSSALLGSVARQIVRQAKTPVWVIRPRRAYAARVLRQRGRRRARLQAA